MADYPKVKIHPTAKWDGVNVPTVTVKSKQEEDDLGPDWVDKKEEKKDGTQSAPAR